MWALERSLETGTATIFPNQRRVRLLLRHNKCFPGLGSALSLEQRYEERARYGVVMPIYLRPIHRGTSSPVWSQFV